MKHLLLAGAVFLAALGFCIGASVYVRSAVSQTAETLTRAQRLIEEENYPAAANEIAQAQTGWKRATAQLETLLAHEAVDETGQKLAALRAYALCEDAESFSATCAELQALLEQIREMQLPRLQNIL